MPVDFSAALSYMRRRPFFRLVVIVKLLYLYHLSCQRGRLIIRDGNDDKCGIREQQQILAEKSPPRED